MEIFKDKSFLEEDYRVDDKLDFSNLVSRYEQTLNKIEKSSLIGIVGRFGSGKSTLINQIKNKNDNTKQWIHFDAWKFPERKELWDGLVLETARQISNLDSVKRKIDGQSGKDKKLAINTAGSIANVVAACFGLSKVVEPLFNLVKNLDYFTETSPAKRVFEIQEVFNGLINTIEKDTIIFVVEDVDRSGQEGLFFLETFRNFIKENDLNKKIIIICPVGNKNFERDCESYIKIFDYIYDFNLEKINLSDFINSIFIDDILGKELIVSQINYLFNLAINQFDLTIREIKLILRKFCIEFSRFSEEDQSNINIPIMIMFIIENYKNPKSPLSSKSIATNNFWAGHFIIMVAHDKDPNNFKDNHYKDFPIFIKDEKQFFKPKYAENHFYSDQSGYYLIDFNKYLT